jgi:hypothetical protein
MFVLKTLDGLPEVLIATGVFIAAIIVILGIVAFINRRKKSSD